MAALGLPPRGSGFPSRGDGLLFIAAPDDVTAHERLVAEQKQTDSVVQSLAGHVRSCWDAANRARQTVEAKMLSARRQRRGEYEPSKLAQIRKTGGSEIFMMLTAVKCRAAESWIRDTLMPAGDRPWTIEPTPISDLPPEKEEALQRTVTNLVWQEGMQRALMAGLPEQAAQQHVMAAMPEMAQKMRDLIDRDRQEQAKSIAEKMADKIEDTLLEGGWIDAFDALVCDLTTYPAAFLAGPVIRRRKTAKWVMGDDGKWGVEENDEIVTDVEHVSPLDIYPSPWSTTIDDGYLIRRHRLSRADLSTMKGVPGYDDAAISAVLEEYGRGGLRDWLTMSVDYDFRRDTGGEIGPDRPIDAVEFWGSVPGSMLLEWGIGPEQIQDPSVEVDCCVWLIGRWVIKALLNPDAMGRKPFFKASYEIVPGEFWGRSVPELIEDSQAMCNAAARALANNMGISSGPQVEVNVDRLPAGEVITSMYPWKIWQTTSDKSGNGQPAIRFFQPSALTGELIGIFDRFSRIADDESGVPSYSYGDAAQGGAASTASGLSMLFNASGKGIKSVIANLDRGIIAPLITRFYDHIMRFGEDDSIKGDLRIVARGATAMIVREQMTLRRQEFLASTANPLDSQIIGVEGRAELLREQVKSLDMPVDRIVPGREEIAAKMQEAKAQAQAQQQQQQTAGPAIAGARADGGPVEAGKAYLVGERGPEVVVPAQNGVVIPNERLTPGQAILGNGHLRGLSPENRTQALRVAEAGLNQLAGMVPVTGEAYQLGRQIADGDYSGAAMNVASRAVEPLLKQAPLAIKALSSVGNGLSRDDLENLWREIQ